MLLLFEPAQELGASLARIFVMFQRHDAHVEVGASAEHDDPALATVRLEYGIVYNLPTAQIDHRVNAPTADLGQGLQQLRTALRLFDPRHGDQIEIAPERAMNAQRVAARLGRLMEQ